MHRLFCEFVLCGSCMLPDRRRKGSEVADSGEQPAAAQEMAQQQGESQERSSGPSQVPAQVKCSTWQQLRKHFRLELLSKYPGAPATEPTHTGDCEEDTGTGDLASSEAQVRLRELCSKMPRVGHDLGQFLLENSSEDPVDVHVTLARCLGTLRRRIRADLQQVFCKDPRSVGGDDMLAVCFVFCGGWSPPVTAALGSVSGLRRDPLLEQPTCGGNLAGQEEVRRATSCTGWHCPLRGPGVGHVARNRHLSAGKVSTRPARRGHCAS